MDEDKSLEKSRSKLFHEWVEPRREGWRGNLLYGALRLYDEFYRTFMYQNKPAISCSSEIHVRIDLLT